jgi:predicted  nucleic acid-binding Zn-ribbon protein
MPALNVVLLEDARARRAKAKHIREICQNIYDIKTIETLKTYAEGLEQQASDLEAQADRASKLAADVAGEITKARDTLKEIKAALAGINPDQAY